MPERWTPTLDDFVDLASVVLDASEEAIRRFPRLPLAESAIAAPFASFGGTDAYPGLIEQAAVLVTHLAQNHPLPDGNKRVSFLLMVRFLAANGAAWGEPDINDDAGTVERIAAGTADRAEAVAWIERRTRLRAV